MSDQETVPWHRVGWAKYYEAREDTKRALAIGAKYQERLAGLCLLIADNECLAQLEPEGDVICEARKIIAAMRLTPRGVMAINRAKEARR